MLFTKSDYTVEIITRQSLQKVATYTVSEWSQCSAQHTALRIAIREGHDIPQHRGLCARVTGVTKKQSF